MNANHFHMIILVGMVLVCGVTVISANVSGEIMGMSLTMPLSMSLYALGLSILHPGGWLILAGLITASRKIDYRWHGLTVLGAIITGLTVPIIEGIGAAAF